MSRTTVSSSIDLKVEVVAPEGASIYCGAKPGDYFELKGEMLHLPPGQGFSIYSLAALLPLLPAKQRPTHPNDWMSTDAEVACPDPNCPTRFRITRTGKRTIQPAETTAVPLPGERRWTVTMVAIVSLRPGYEISRIIRGGWQLAGGHGAVDRSAAIADLVAFCEAGITTFDCADIYTGVEELIGAVPRASIGSGDGARGARAHQGPHQIRARPRHPADVDRAYVRTIIDPSLRRLARWSGSTSCSSTGGTMPCRAMSRPPDGSRSCSRRARSTGSAAPISTRRTRAELVAAGIALVSMQVQYSLLDARPEHGLVALCREQ